MVLIDSVGIVLQFVVVEPLADSGLLESASLVAAMLVRTSAVTWLAQWQFYDTFWQGRNKTERDGDDNSRTMSMREAVHVMLRVSVCTKLIVYRVECVAS